MHVAKQEAPPSYEIEPREDERFYPSKVREIIKSYLESVLKNYTYDNNSSAELCEKLTREIRDKVRENHIPRYKILVQVVIGELKGQGLRIMSQGLWYDKLDNYADYTFTNVGYGLRKKGFYCTAMVWGCYND